MQLNRFVNPSPIKSIQRGTASYVTGNSAALAVVVASINTAKSLLTFSVQCNSGSNDPNQYLLAGKITSSMAISFQRTTGTNTTLTIEWELVEYV